MNCIADSDVVIDFFNKRKEIEKKFYSLSIKNTLYISVLSITEVRSGWTQKQADAYLSVLFDIFKVEGISNEIALYAGKLRFEYKRKGITLSTNDTLIAATAIKGNYQLITRNLKHFPMPQLKIYKF